MAKPVLWGDPAEGLHDVDEARDDVDDNCNKKAKSLIKDCMDRW